MLDRISAEYPQVDDISVVFTISKKKKLDEVFDLFQADKRITQVHVVGKPHFKLKDPVEAHETISKHEGFSKLKPLVVSDKNKENNIGATLDKIMQDKPANQLVLICGSFFIMTDVRDHFGVSRFEQADDII